MSRQRRNLDFERAAVNAAAERLLAGTPLRSNTAGLTATELIIESGLRRDVIYRDHKDLVDLFAARVRAQSFVPDTVREVIAERDRLKAKLADTSHKLVEERQTSATLRRTVAELSLELQLAQEQLSSSAKVVRLPSRRSG